MHWDYLKRWTNLRRQLSTPKINVYKNKEITQKSPETALVCLFCYFIDILTFKKSMHVLFNPKISKWVWSGNTTITNRRQPRGTARKSLFCFLNVNFMLSVFYELLKSTVPLSTFFTLYDVWNAFWQCLSPFEIRSCHLRSFSDVNLTITCRYEHTAKLELHTR